MKVESGSINNQINVGATKDKKVSTGADKKVSEPKTPDLASSAKVNISAKAQEINKATELATPDMDTIREDKVAHFQSLIDKGEYSVDASSVADRLVDEHLFS